MKVHYTFNYRECFKFVTSFCKIEGNYLKTEANVVKLFYHEAVRQYADKILMKHDLNWFMDNLKQVCYDCFDLTGEEDDGKKGSIEEEGSEKDAKLPQPGVASSDAVSQPAIAFAA